MKGRTKLAKEQITEIRQRAAQRESKSQLAREFGICRATIYKYLKEHQQ
ncbi:MAG: Hin recombinase [Gammaproteobacteria bacterium]|nr:Hin recombinase [Gammaproteobacteria bacterium]